MKGNLNQVLQHTRHLLYVPLGTLRLVHTMGKDTVWSFLTKYKNSPFRRTPVGRAKNSHTGRMGPDQVKGRTSWDTQEGNFVTCSKPLVCYSHSRRQPTSQRRRENWWRLNMVAHSEVKRPTRAEILKFNPARPEDHFARHPSLSSDMLPIPERSPTSVNSSPIYLRSALTIVSIIRVYFDA
jgi:3-hydroxyacyl-CoA dehydrogenase